MESVTIKLDLAKYRRIELSKEKAIELLNILLEEKSKDEVKEALRITENFNIFYDMMRRKQRDYIPLPHDYSDLLKGDVSIDKIRLERRGNDSIVVLVFDKRFPLEDLSRLLKEIGYREVKIENLF
ncbi:MAG: hypothetical protein F7B59_01575 [Desulfurococcales archaeon]|nr:hypothetical protein [Desulfurococcales archaeon]